MNSPIPSVVSEPIQRLIQLFEDRTEELKFPGVDAARLTAAAEALTQQLHELESLQARLEEAHRSLSQRHKDLLLLAKQAHAYASVYAQTDPELQRALSQIPLTDAERGGRRARQRTSQDEGRHEENRADDTPSPEPPRAVEAPQAPAAQTLAAQTSTAQTSTAQTSAAQTSAAQTSAPPRLVRREDGDDSAKQEHPTLNTAQKVAEAELVVAKASHEKAAE